MKIPSEAKRVFKGTIFDVYQWQQKMFDGSFATFEMLKRPITVDIIATKGDKIFLSHQSQPNKHNFYSLFGGRGEENEEPLITAKRELLEESGLQSSDWELIKIYEPFHKINWQIYLFAARNCQKVAEPKPDAGEQIETIECTFDKFIEIIQSDNYWGDHLLIDILKMRLDKQKLENFKRIIFK